VGGALPADQLRDQAALLGQAANVRAVLPDTDAAALDRAMAAWDQAARAHIHYLIHDADPLAEVAAAWVDRWDGTGDIGQLEIAVQAVLQRWRAGSLELPDYYLLVDAQALAPTARHWYLGVLRGARRTGWSLSAPVRARPPVRCEGCVRAAGGHSWTCCWLTLTRRVPDALQLGLAAW
jgi:hypothetical protein